MKINKKFNFLKLIFYLTYANCQNEFCSHVKHGLSTNTFIDQFNETFLREIFNCPIEICSKNPCNIIKNAKKGSCKVLENAIYETDFECECLRNSFWSKTLKKCLINNSCFNELQCGGPLRSEKCLFNENTGHIECKCKIEWMGENCDKKRDACIENYYEHLKSGTQSCGPNGVCKGLNSL